MTKAEKEALKVATARIRSLASKMKARAMNEIGAVCA